MVKVGILDAEKPIAGEIIRILTNHPETEIKTLVSPLNMGRTISSIHHGLIGESPKNFTDKINLEELDFLIVPEDSKSWKDLIPLLDDYPDLKLVLLPFENSGNTQDYEIGLSEINRKALVRGAKKAYLLSPCITPALISLIPLASFLLLNDDIEIEVSLPSDISNKIDVNAVSSKLLEILKKKQISFEGKVNLKLEENNDSERISKTVIYLRNSLPIEEIEKIYDQIYDDHNFTFITHNPVTSKEVEGTQKVIINLNKENEDNLIINIIADPRMRGGAGDAVHIMNLLFGLHEKTGLTLKSSRY